MKKTVTTLAFVIFLFGSATFAETLDEAKRAYQNVTAVTNFSIAVPTVVEVPFVGEQTLRNNFLVVDDNTGTAQPWSFGALYEKTPVPLTVSSVGTGYPYAMIDENSETYTDYQLPSERSGTAQIVIAGAQPIASSELTFELARNVALPSSIEIRTRDTSGVEKIVVARKKMSSTRVVFPKTLSSEWIIDLTYSQPLRINEIRLRQDDVEQKVKKMLRFLAQPGSTYSVYYNPDRQVAVQVGELADLRGDKGVLVLPQVSGEQNVLYAPADVDSDGVVDVLDNCVTNPNPEQVDVDGNGRGDVCDDFDRDGILNVNDNCPDLPNRYQRDEDGDGIGDECDLEESRFTEQHKWIPWAGMGIAAIVLIVLFTLVATKRPDQQSEDSIG